MLHKPVWTGIDIGHHSVKAVVLKQNKGRLALLHYAEVALSSAEHTGASPGGGLHHNSLSGPILLSALRKIRTLLPKRSARTVLSLPDSEVVQQELTLEQRWGQDIGTELAKILAGTLSMEPEALSLDYYPAPLSEQGETDSGLRFQVFAAKTSALEARTQSVREAGFDPVIMELQARALLWLLAYCHRQAITAMGVNPALVCLGAEEADLAAGFSHSLPLHRTFMLSRSGNAPSSELLRQLLHYHSLSPLTGLWLTGRALSDEELAWWQQACGLPVALLTPGQVFPLLHRSPAVAVPHDTAWARAAALAVRGALSC
ncbi:type IV pilus biogenesis protein PilM [Photobacterium halotolerans]|uniref:Pilus assembly protein PilM n=1 Tax=Photobacterium halotolerans TaxID=265726 RepID=A0A7X5B010_9GAMM|nr:pilus assembly protein PilM [Photobacterium halotolerans]NAW66271.1 pilus assembly protein PilM [Photobacterium halotolerans]NAW88295.1 pilus assembly protein PilM [Photobacterium halotolerans]